MNIQPHALDSAGRVEHGQRYRDLRAHNERRLSRARLLDAQRSERIERVMQVARERRFRRGR